MNESAETAAGLIDIAVVDDDSDFLNYMEDLLRDEGKYTVRTFEKPERFFAFAEARLPDILLLDMKMAPARGEEVVEQVLARWPDVCIIVVTGYPSLENMRATFKLRVFDYLAKPFSLSQLRQTLQKRHGAIQPRANGTGSLAKSFGTQNEIATSGAKLVAEGPGNGNKAERLPNQFHRTWNKPSER